MTEERKQFEAWAKMFGAQPDLTKANGGANYADPFIDIAWLAWKASRAAQPVSPALKLPDERVDSGVNGRLYHNEGWNACLAEVKRLNAIHTAPIEPICATGGAEWVKVPREPTQKMIDAHMDGMVKGGAMTAYRQMLAAADELSN